MQTTRIGDTSTLAKRRKVNTSAGCYIVRENGGNVELLVLKKEWPDEETKYVLPKGHCEGRETLEETALRETKEESGYADIKLLRYLGSTTYELDWKKIQVKTDHYYLAILNSDRQNKRKQETYEEGVVVENQWLPLEKGLELLTYENIPELNKVLRKYIQEEITH